MDELFQELAAADEGTYARIERQIIAQWEQSGSAAMDLLLRRGKDALEDGAPDVAVEHFTAAIDHAPGFAEAYYGRASAYYLLGRIGPALSDVERALALNPRHFEAMSGLALVMEELERFDDALEIYEMVLAIHPNASGALEGAARMELQLEGQAL